MPENEQNSASARTGIPSSSLNSAAYRGNTEAIVQLLDAGANVNAFRNEMPTATVIVKPNCLKKMPVVPPMNDTGMKITINTRVVVNSVTANPFMASTEAL